MDSGDTGDLRNASLPVENRRSTLDQSLLNFAASAAANINCAQLKELKDFDACVDGLLAKLDEYNGLIDMIRGDSNLCLGRTLVEICARQPELEVLFHKVDQLENLVGAVRNQVGMMEHVVNDAELESSQTSKVKRLLNSLPEFLGGTGSAEKKSPVAMEASCSDSTGTVTDNEQADAAMTDKQADAAMTDKQADAAITDADPNASGDMLDTLTEQEAIATPVSMENSMQ